MRPESFTIRAAEAIQQAEKYARSQGHPEIAPIHLLAALVAERGGVIHQIAARKNANISEIQNRVDATLEKIPRQFPGPSNLQPSRSFVDMLGKAQEIMSFLGDSHIAVDVLVIALTNIRETKAILSESGLSPVDIDTAVKEARQGKTVESVTSDSTANGIAGDALAKYGVNLVEQVIAGRIDPVIGRDEEIRRTIRVLCRRTKSNPILIGPPGVGKTAIVEGLAQRIACGDVPKSLNCTLHTLDMGLLVAGAKFRGEFEERVKDVLEQVKQAKGTIILFIDEIHLVLGAGVSGSDSTMDAANLFKPMLARGQLRCIGATTLDEYRKHVERDAAFERRFQPIYVGEPSIPDTIAMIRGLRERYETHHGVLIRDAAIVSAVTMAARYITNRFLPDKAIDLIDEACADVRVTLDTHPEEIDAIQRRKLRLEIEATALEREKDVEEASRARYAAVKAELATLDERLAPLLHAYESLRERIDELASCRRKLAELQAKLADAVRRRDKNLAADLEFGAIPDLQQRIQKLQGEEAARGHAADEGMELEHLPAPIDTPDDGTISAADTTEVVGETHVLAIVSRWTGIPLSRLSESEAQRLLALQDRLSQRVIGQENAIVAVSDAILRNRSGLSRPSQPIGSFLFLGPTGVGKTELAKAIFAELFLASGTGAESSAETGALGSSGIVRIDMSEYMEKHAISRLIGAPPGYVGYGESGQLSEAVRRRPYSVVLFDEIEKAHPEILDILLQILDDGRLTDGQGRLVDFSNTLIILTTNISVPSSHQVDSVEFRRALSLYFRPEFVNRLDDVVIFHALTKASLFKIIERLGDEEINERMAAKDIRVNITEQAKEAIVEAAYEDGTFGARPLRRYIEKHIVTPISRMVISGQLPRHSTVFVGVMMVAQSAQTADESVTFSFDVQTKNDQ